MRNSSSRARGGAGRSSLEHAPHPPAEARESAGLLRAAPRGGRPLRAELCGKSNVRRLCPVAVQSEAHADRDLDRRDRPLRDVEGLEQQQLTRALIQAVADLHDPAVTLARSLVAGDETRLLQARNRTAPPVLPHPGREVLVEEAVHEEAVGAAAAQLHRSEERL